MTSDVDKLNDKDDIVWNENDQGDSMEQYFMLWSHNVWLRFHSFILMNNGSW